MGNTCTTADDIGAGDARGRVPYYDIRTRGCPSDPAEYISAFVPAEAKRRYVLDHIRYTIAQRRKDQAFSRPLDPPPLGPGDIAEEGLAALLRSVIDSNSGDSSSSSPDPIFNTVARDAIDDALRRLEAAAEEMGLTDALQPNVIDKLRVVPELEETTHERIVAALVRSKEAIEAAFLLPMEAVVLAPEPMHEYSRDASAAAGGGILKGAGAGAGGDEGKPKKKAGVRIAGEADGNGAFAAAKDEANAASGDERAGAAPPPLPPAAVQHACIPWQVARLSWLTTIELATMDTGAQLLPGQAKHSSNKNRRPQQQQQQQQQQQGNVADNGADDGLAEGQEFSMLRHHSSHAGPQHQQRGGHSNADSPPELIPTPSSTVEVAFAAFPIDASVERMVRWGEERAKMAVRYAASRHSMMNHNAKQNGNAQLSHYRATVLAREMAAEERLRKLFAMVATRPLTPADHPLHGGSWANPSHPRARALAAAHSPHLVGAHERLRLRNSSGGGVVVRDERGGEAEEAAEIGSAIAELLAQQAAHVGTSGGGGATTDALSSADNFNAALLTQLRRNAASHSQDGLSSVAYAGSDVDAPPLHPATNRNAAPPKGGRQPTAASSAPHPPHCLCQRCIDNMWADVDLRHLVNWPPTACVSRPTIAVLSHTSAIETVVVSSAPQSNNASSRQPNSNPNPSPPRRRADDGGDFSDGDADGERLGGGGEVFTNIETAAEATSGGVSVQLVRRHKATVVVLFYHHRLTSSNALQRRLLGEDTVSVPLLQPEASASGGALLGSSRARGRSDDGGQIMARKARLEMLSNYRDLRRQQRALEHERRQRIGDGISLAGGWREGNGAAALPESLASASASVYGGVWFDRAVCGTGVDLPMASAAVGRAGALLAGEANAPPSGGGLGLGLGATQAPVLAVTHRSQTVPSGVAGDTGAPVTVRARVPIPLASSAGAPAPPSTEVSAAVSAFHAADLPHFPPRCGTVSFATSRADSDVFTSEARVPPPHSHSHSHAAASTGHAADTSSTSSVGRAVRAAAASEPPRLDAVDVVVEALQIELEALELIGQEELAALYGAEAAPDADGPLARVVVDHCAAAPLVGPSRAHAAAEVSLLSTIAPALDVRGMAADGGGRGDGGEPMPTVGSGGGLTFHEPLVMTANAARGVVSKARLRAERRKDIDDDDFVSGRNFRATSRARDGHEAVRTDLAIRMMASHYAGLLDADRAGERNQQQQQQQPLAAVLQQRARHMQHDLSQYQSFLAQVASQVQCEIWMKDLFPL